MLLAELIEASGAKVQAVSGNPALGGMTADSRKAKQGDLFVCMPSDSRDTHSFLADIKAKGAVAALAHSLEGFEAAKRLGLGALWAPTGPEFHEALWRLAKAQFGNPSQGMRVVGITGTNGKTSTAWFLWQLLQTLSGDSAYLGTLGLFGPGFEEVGHNTTPFPVELMALISELRDKGVKNLAMEVSSHALDQRRADGVEFDAAIFTNLSQDHLDYHGDMDAYAAAKRRLFDALPAHSSKSCLSAYNVDDEVGRLWHSELGGIGFGLKGGDLVAVDPQIGLDKISFTASCKRLSIPVEVPVGSYFNLLNALGALAGAFCLGYPLRDAAEALRTVRPVPGRFESVPMGESGVTVLVDYAHTPDALEKLLDSVRALAGGRVIAVFGCGGDRDRSKRPLMARAVTERADFAILTSDNPRTEQPLAILKDVEAGVAPNSKYLVQEDRRLAIHDALGLARPGDVVVIAGKGHETYQLIGGKTLHFDDREVALEAMGALR